YRNGVVATPRGITTSGPVKVDKAADGTVTVRAGEIELREADKAAAEAGAIARSGGGGRGGAVGVGGGRGRGAGEPGSVSVREPGAESIREDLGQQTIEGVVATGTRLTTTIPAGAIGNEQPIKIVSEQWMSPDLKVIVLTKHSDPRTGDTTYRMLNIARSEQARSLFEVPPDYTV